MGKHDDDDDDAGDEKSAYSSNARSADRGKEGDDADDDEGALSPVIKAFCRHVVCDKFRRELEAFFTANSDGFEDAKVGSEQRLEWTSVFEKYIAVVERMLEEFCFAHDLTADGVFKMVQRTVRSGMLDDEFLPAVLGVTDYPFFIEQIGLVASEAKNVRAATQAVKKGDQDNISGMWRTATKDKKGNLLTETKGGLERYLQAVGVPKSLHNLFKASLFSKKGLLIVHDGENLTLIADTLTGRHEQTFHLDGQTREVANAAGTKTPFSARGPDRGGRIVVRNSKPSGLQKGSALQQTWVLASPDLLQCTVEVERPAGVVMHEFFYARQSAPKDKSQTASSHK